MSRRNPYGIHFIPTHQAKLHYDHIRDSRPGLVKLVSDNGAPDVQQMADCYAAAPHAIHVYRNHPLSEEHDALWRNPVGTAIHHAATWQNEMRTRRDQAKRRGLVLPPMEQTSVTGINEPVVELFPRKEDMSNYDEWLAMTTQRAALLDDYMAMFIWECIKYGQPCHVGNISGGQPPNLKPGDYATWDWFPKTRHAMQTNRRMTALAVHEYWDIQGPFENRDWWTFRFFYCDWDIDAIDVLECGVDRAIRSHQYEGSRGYKGHLTCDTYAGQMYGYIAGCLDDPRFRCATPFTLNGDKIWESFWIDYCLPELTDVSRRLQEAIPAQPAPAQQHNAYVPHVATPQPQPTAEPEQPQPKRDNWERVWPIVLRFEGELSLDPEDAGNWYNGKLVGTKYGISAAVWGGRYDIPNLTQEQALAIYRKHYWQASGADQMAWPLCLVHFDAYVQNEAAARIFLHESGGNVWVYLANRNDWYTRISKWGRFGRGWHRRVSELMRIAAEAA